MEIREIVAYAIIVLMAASFIGAVLYATRERRRHRRAHRRYRRQQAIRMMEERGGQEVAG